MKKRKKTITKLKKELDKVFSLYIRQRDMLVPDGTDYVVCFTCSSVKHWKEMHAGHFMSRKHLSTRWDLENVQVQCPKCNLFGQGEQYQFGIMLDVKYGPGTADKLKAYTKLTIKMTSADYEEMIDIYKKKLAQL